MYNGSFGPIKQNSFIAIRTAFELSNFFRVPVSELEGLINEPPYQYFTLDKKKGASAPLKAFCQAVKQAEAVARLQAEVAALKAKPLDWLRHGPGRPRENRDGWTAAARAERATEITEPELPWALVHELVTRLEPWPEARVAVAEWLMGTCRQEGTKDTIQVYSSGADETSDTGAAE